MNRTNKILTKEQNPFETANIFSKWTFWWVLKLFYKGYGRPLREEELYANPKNLDSKTITNNFNKIWNEQLKKSNPSIFKAIVQGYGMSVIPLAFAYALLESVTRIMQPLSLGNLVSYFAQSSDNKIISKEEAYINAAILILCSLIPVLLFHPFIFKIFTIATKIRLACAGLIYRKALRISKNSTNDGLSARAINILSNDIGKFDIALAFFHDIWKGPLEAIILGYIMYTEIGIPAVIGIGFMLSFIPLQAWGASKAAVYRKRTAERTDKRVKLMNEIIQGIQVIKMYAWEHSFAKVIAKLRHKEINAIRGTMRIFASLGTTAMISKFTIFLSLVSYVYMGDEITARKVYIVSAICNVLNDSMVHFWPLAITYCAEGYISCNRVRDFLLEDEGWSNKSSAQDTKEKDETTMSNGSSELLANDLKQRRIVKLDTNSKGIKFCHAFASWTSSNDEVTANKSLAINDFNFRIEEKSLVAVVGQVGAGKSSLLNVILGELELMSGTVEINGRLSYACQEPWLFEGSIKDNIVFIEKFDEKRYKKVIKVCALERDLELFPHGDSTIVGERGISLSGGQKARVNLARAIYKIADIYLLDDPLSAVDAHVGKHIFEKCILNFLSDKCCVLVTHQLQYLKDVEHLILINSGKIDGIGSYHALQSSNKFEFLNSTHDESGDKTQSNRSSISESEKKIELIQRLISTQESKEDKGEDRKELQAVGAVKLGVYKSYFKALDNICWLISIVALFILVRILLSGVDYFISRWVNWEEKVSKQDATTKSISESKLLPFNMYGSNNSTYDESIQNERNNLVTIYSLLLGITIILYIARTFGFFQMCLKISEKLHDQLFRGITRSTMYFFNMNPSGRILNRFSKDIGAADTNLPMALLDCTWFFTDVTGVLIVVSIANYWLLLPALAMIVLFYLMRCFYINTSRSVKRIESMSRSPIYSHTNQTFQGLTTIRALQAQNELESYFHEYQNGNTSAWYIFLATTRSFALWLDFFCVVYIAVVTLSFLIFESQFTSGDVGLAILQCNTMIGMCQWGMRQTAELENQMTGIERILEYVDQPSEPSLQSLPENKPNEDWPKLGQIKFSNFNLKYSEDGEYILNNLNFEIDSEEKIGIVGRTGAGKSSIIQAVFRLAFNDGLVAIDNVDINKLGLHDLRNKISIIPQDPVVFSGTLRYNLDPFETATDDEIWSALEDVELKSHVNSLVGGLYSKMSDGGSNFSMGQRQLVCLARAILRNNKILILDEATANVDPETDKLIQKTIKTKFSHCTVLTIAHRLHTVMDSDRVLVMDAGRSVEIGHPHILLQDPNGFLRKLVDQTGSKTAAILEQTASKNYINQMSISI